MKQQFIQLLRSTNRQGIENVINWLEESDFFTAPASITGLPCVATKGVQFIGKAFSENVLLNLASIIEKGGKN